MNFSHASEYVVVVGHDRTEGESRKTKESMSAEIVDDEVFIEYNEKIYIIYKNVIALLGGL
mgnify:CR=1 FL=1